MDFDFFLAEHLEGVAFVERLGYARLGQLGAPLTGVPLEKLVHVAAFTLTTIWNPVTRLIGRAMNRRSAAIKDLRYGHLVDEDWSGRDPDAPRWPCRQPVPGLAAVPLKSVALAVHLGVPRPQRPRARDRVVAALGHEASC